MSGDRIARLVAAWRLPDSAHTIMLPARLTRWKGHATMLDAFARLPQRDACLVLVGSPTRGASATAAS